MLNSSLPKARITWIDSAKGVCITLLVLHHVIFSYSSISSDLPMQGIWSLFWNGTLALGLFRMPAFFFCSGLVMSMGSSKRTWAWLVEKRLVFFVWVIAFWTVMCWVSEVLGLHLYPAGKSPVVDASNLFILPYGNLWFVYAILCTTLLQFFIGSWRPWLALFAVVVLVVASSYVIERVDLGSYKLFVHGLVYYGLFFFSAGAFMGPWLVSSLERWRPSKVILISFTCVVASGMLMGIYMFEGASRTFFVSVPFVFSFLSFVYYLNNNRLFERVFSSLGAKSLQVFILHQFFVAAFFYLLPEGLKYDQWPISLVFVWILTVALSYLLAVGSSKLGADWLFRSPEFLKKAVMKFYHRAF